jgi:TPR repeat protein
MVPARFLALALCMLLPASLAGEQAPDRSAWELLERAESLYSGSGGRVDEGEARSLFEKAEATGDPVARLRAATLRHLGRSGFDKDPARAAGLAAAVLDAVRRLAEKGDPAAQTAWATALLVGVGLPADPAAALPWFQKAAGQGQTWAMYNLGWMFAAGEGVTADPAQALAWYTQAAERGNAGAMLEAGLFHLNGVGTPEDAAKGLTWIRRAAERRHPRAMAELAGLEFNGIVPATPESTFGWARRAAEAGSVLGMRLLGQCYGNGRGVAADRRLALDWYRKAGDAGDPISVYWIGQAYFKGDGVPADPRQGVLLYEKSAAMGFVSAAHDLARIYENGWYGVSKDVEKARVHYRRAAELGDEEAIGWLKYEKLPGRE